MPNEIDLPVQNNDAPNRLVWSAATGAIFAIGTFIFAYLGFHVLPMVRARNDVVIYCVAPPVSFITGAILWWLLVARIKSITLKRGCWAGAFIGLMTHLVASYVVILFPVFSSVWKPPSGLTHIIIHIIVAGLYAFSISLSMIGWITIPAGMLIGCFISAREGRVSIRQSFKAMSKLNKIFLVGILFVPMLLLSQSAYGLMPYSGRVIDAETGMAIEGAVIVRSWVRETATPAGGVTSLIGIKEAVTGENGDFTVLSDLHIPTMPIISEVTESQTVIYKPGYKFVTFSKKKPIIALERMPTSLNLRAREADEARRYHFGVFDNTKFLKDIVERESEFTNNSLGYSIPVAAVHGTPPTGGTYLPDDHIRGHAGPCEPRRGENADAAKNARGLCYMRILSDRGAGSAARGNAAWMLGLLKDNRAFQPLADALNDTDDEVRMQSLRGLGQLGDPKAIPYLRKALDDKRIEVRSAAVGGLGYIDDPAVIQPLIYALKDNSFVGENAFSNLVKIGQPAVGPLIGCLDSEDQNVRSKAISALGRIGDRQALNPLLDLLNSHEQKMSADAASALANFQDPVVAKALVNAMRSSDLNLHSASKYALCRNGILPNELLEMLNDNDAKNRRDAAELLGCLKDPRSVEPLINAFKDSDRQVIKNVIVSLARIKDPRAVEPLISLWQRDESDIRIAAAKALIDIGAPSVKPLIAEMNNMNSYVRWRSAWCLGIMKSQEAEDALIVLLSDRVSEVRWIAINALGMIGDSKIVPNLVKLCNDKDAGIREIVNFSIKRISGQSACQDASIN